MLSKLCAPLTKDDVELRVGTCSAKGFSLLLYKTARTDVNRLNSACGMLWSNSHKVDSKGNVTCHISVYDKVSSSWVSREDTGSESNTEKEKGSYSDSFKRAGFRWGIGIELYKSPFIWVSGNVKENPKNKVKYIPDLYTNALSIDEYTVVDGIPQLTITHKNKAMYSNIKSVKLPSATNEFINRSIDKIVEENKDPGKACEAIKKVKDLTQDQECALLNKRKM